MKFMSGKYLLAAISFLQEPLKFLIFTMLLRVTLKLKLNLKYFVHSLLKFKYKNYDYILLMLLLSRIKLIVESLSLDFSVIL